LTAFGLGWTNLKIVKVRQAEAKAAEARDAQATKESPLEV